MIQGLFLKFLQNGEDTYISIKLVASEKIAYSSEALFFAEGNNIYLYTYVYLYICIFVIVFIYIHMYVCI